MNNTVLLTVRTDRKLKEAAQKVAREMGIPLTAIVNAHLRSVVLERSVTFNTPLEPNEATKKSLARIDRDICEGKNLLGPFRSAKEAIAFLKSA